MKLRHVTDDDHEFLVRLHNDPDVLRNVTDPTPITMESHMKWWKSRGSSEMYRIFEVDGTKVGFTKFRPIDSVNRNVTLGADIAPEHRSKGYAVPMWKLMLSECFDVMDLHRASLITAAYNTRAIHVYKKVGFEIEGYHREMLFRNNVYHDAVLMYMNERMWAFQSI